LDGSDSVDEIIFTAWNAWKRGTAVACLAAFSVFMAGLYVALPSLAIIMLLEGRGIIVAVDEWFKVALLVTSIFWVPYGIGRVAKVDTWSR
jgi:hypothetical protein